MAEEPDIGPSDMSLVQRAQRLARRTRRALPLAVRWSDKLRVTWLIVGAPIRRRLKWKPRVMSVRLRAPFGAVDWAVGDDADIVAFIEVCADDGYSFGDVPPAATIVDLGCHSGASILMLHHRFPQAHIIGCEPDPVSFAKLRRNVGNLPGVELHQVAITDRDGPVNFYSSGAHDSWASSTHRSTPWQSHLTVRGRQLDSLLSDCGVEHVDLLKLDIEGSEYQVLRCFRGLGAVHTIVGEVHPELVGKGVEEFRALLSGFETDLPPAGSRKTNFRALRTVNQ